MTDPTIRAAETGVCDEILSIMETYREQEAAGCVDTPGGLEHMGDVWAQLSEWDEYIRKARSEPLPETAQAIFKKEQYGAVVATILENDHFIVEVQERNDGFYGLIVHHRRHDKDMWDDLTAYLKPEHFDMLGSVAARMRNGFHQGNVPKATPDPLATAEQSSIKNARIFAVSAIKYSLDHVIAQFDQMMANGMIPDIRADYVLSNARLAIMAINDGLK